MAPWKACRISPSLRESYIQISRYVRGGRTKSPGTICQQASPSRRVGSIRRELHTSSRLCAQVGETSDQGSGSTSRGKRYEIFSQLSEENRSTFQQYWDRRFVTATATWLDLTDLQKNQKKLLNTIRIHGYMTQRREANKSLTFGILVSPNLRQSVQLVHSTTTAQKTDSSPTIDGQESDEIHVAEGLSSTQDDTISGETDQETRLRRHSLNTQRIFRSLNAHTPVVVHGRPKPRQEKKKGQVKYDQHTGFVDELEGIEIEVMSIFSLNSFPEHFIAKAGANFPPEQRHMQFRTDRELRDRIRRRSQATALARRMLFTEGFDEIETPYLFKSTPEGAREFIVPTRQEGMAYALPQSPQQFKQLLMASGFHKYFQFARCFRDEDSRTDRQPEFTQLDLEVAFADARYVMGVVETLILNSLMPNLLKSDERPKYFTGSATDGLRIPVLTYRQAMTNYGSDKPDDRFGAKIHQAQSYLPSNLVGMLTSLKNPIVEILKLEMEDTDPQTSRAFVSSFMQLPSSHQYTHNPDGMPGVTVFDPSKPLEGLASFGHEAAQRVTTELQPKAGDIIVLQSRKRNPTTHTGGSTPLGNLRVDLHRRAVAEGHVKPKTQFSMLWITEFPMFTQVEDNEAGNEGTAGLCSTHHPFTAPLMHSDTALKALIQDPMQALGDHFDLVINGVEVGGGSVRINDAKMQEYIFRDVLKMKEERIEDFRHLLQALEAGCPPHVGFALGFDRLMAVILKRDSIRDVIAFPKDSLGQDRFVKSPAQLTPEQLSTYHLSIVKDQDAEQLSERKISLAG